MRSLAVPSLAALVLAGCSSVARTNPPAAPQGPVTTAFYEMHNDSWVNLHHFLYQWAVATEDPARRRSGPVPVPEVAEPSPLSAREQEVWREAVEHYRQNLIRRDLLFDRELNDWKLALTRVEASRSAALEELPADFAGVLRKAMPVYRQHWWPRHQAKSAAWIEEVEPRVRKHEASLLRRLAEVYGGAVPRRKLRVDVSAYSNWAGAYTNETGSTIASADPDYQGHSAFEIVFHESSHIEELETPLRRAISDAFARAGGKAPQDLWHVILFYTVGEVIQEVLRSEGVEDYQTYADRRGLYRRNRWAPLRQAAGPPWTEFLAGRIDRDTALDRIVAELSKGKPG